MNTQLPPDVAAALSRVQTPPPRVFFYPEITSTNDVAARLVDDGAEEGCLVLADAQSLGRGRLGRSWVSPAGAGIYATLILRPSAALASLLTITAGVAIAEGIQSATGLSPRLKWPNDVIVEESIGPAAGRKLAGILAEGGTSAAGSSWVVLGFGINVRPAAYPPEVAARATSLETELGRSVDRGLVLAECVAALFARYRELCNGHATSVIDAWRTRAASMLGRRVEWQSEGKPVNGIARDIDETGALVVSQRDGIVRVISGEVRWM